MFVAQIEICPAVDGLVSSHIRYCARVTSVLSMQKPSGRRTIAGPAVPGHSVPEWPPVEPPSMGKLLVECVNVTSSSVRAPHATLIEPSAKVNVSCFPIAPFSTIPSRMYARACVHNLPSSRPAVHLHELQELLRGPDCP